MHAEGSRYRKIKRWVGCGIGFHPAAIDFDAIKFEGTHDFGKKCGLLLIAFDQDAFQIGNYHTYGYGRKAGTGANVGEPTMAYGSLRDGKHAFAEMEAQNLGGVLNSG